MSIGVTVKAKGPGFTLEECDSTEELKDLKGESKGKGTHHVSNIFLLAPWAVKTVNDANEKDLLKLILKVIKKCEDNNGEIDEDCERVRNHAIALSNFLWLIFIDKITEIKFVVPSENDDSLNYLSERKRKCLALLSSTENTIDSNDSNFRNQGDVLKQLTASIANQLESSKETNKISRLEYERKLIRIIIKQMPWVNCMVLCVTCS